MKTTLQFILLLFFSISTSAQSSISIQINHLLNGEPFEYEMEAQNDLDNKFMLERLQYYLSTFSITHDGGQVTTIDDLYVLVDLATKNDQETQTLIDLGEFDIQNIEGVNFYLGIDEEANHGDPALWPVNHPLAPQFPSMHWGWVAGYRFIALEGMSGPNVDQGLEFHCIGDEFYKEMTFPVAMSGQDTYVIEIDAEYSNILSEIDVSDGLILHGNLNQIKTLASNLQSKVFTASEITGVDDDELVKTFEVFPNPSNDGFINVKHETSLTKTMLTIYDEMGRVVTKASGNTNTIQLTQSGLYFFSLMDEAGNILATRRVIVQ